MKTMVYNLPYCPLDSRAWWGKMQAALKYYQARAGPTSPLLMVLYESICEDFGVKPLDVPRHGADMFIHIADFKALETNGAKAALRRCFSWVEAADRHDRAWNTRLSTFIFLGMATGVYLNLLGVPLLAGRGWKVTRLCKLW